MGQGHLKIGEVRVVVGGLTDRNRPVATLGQLGGSKLEGGRREGQGGAVWVMDFDVSPLGGHHRFDGA